MMIRRLAALGVCMFLTSAADAGDFRDLLEKRASRNVKGEELLYRLLKPADYDAKKKYPLVVFLHGAGERGDDNTAQLVHGIKEFAHDENRKKYPCFLFAPQCPKGKLWANVNWSAKEHDQSPEPSEPMRLTLRGIALLQKEFSIDADRIYVTGLSMGGYGTFDALARHPDLFAAAVPVCGGADVKTAARIKQIPIWAFHGDKDQAVPVSRSRDIVAALKKAGGDPKYTEYKGVGHDSWTPAYKDAEMFAWLFAQKKGKK